jgi:WD40 repeat protein
MKNIRLSTGFAVHSIMLGVMLVTAVTGCSSPTAVGATIPAAKNSAESTVIPSATLGATETPTTSPTQTFTPTLSIPVSQNTSVPTPESSIQESKSKSVIELARWGMGKINHAIMSPDRKFLLAATATGTYIFNPENLKEVAKFGREGQSAEYLSFSPDRQLIAVATNSRKIDVFSVENYTFLFSLGDEIGGYRGGSITKPFFAFTPDSKQIAIIGYDQEQVINIYDLPNGKKNRTIKISDFSEIPDIRSLYSARTNDTLIVEGYGGFILLNRLDDSLIAEIKNLEIRNFTISDDGSILVIQSPDQTRIYKTKTGEQIGSIKPTDFKLDTSIYSEPDIRSVQISPDGKIAALLMSDFQICMWNFVDNAPGSCIKRSDNDAYHMMQFSPDGATLFAASNASIDQWDTSKWEKTREKLIKYETEEIFFSNDTDSILTRQYSSYNTGRLEVINRWGNEDKARLSIKNDGAVRDVHYSPNGKYLAGLGEDLSIVWNPENGEIVTKIKGKAITAKFSNNGKILALSMADQTVQFISLPDGKQISLITDLPDTSSDVFFTGDNKKVAFISGNKALVNKVDDGSNLATIELKSKPILVWPSDGLLLIVESDLTTTLWDEKTLKLLETYNTLIGKVNEPLAMKVSQNNIALLGSDSFNLVTLGKYGTVNYSNKITMGENPNLRVNISGAVAAVNTNEGVQFYDLNGPIPLNVLKKDVSSFDISPAGNEIAAINNDIVEIYPLASLPTHTVMGSAMTAGQPYFLLASNKSSLFSKQAKDASDVIVVEGMGNGMKWLDPQTGKLIGISQTQMENFNIAASPDRETIVLGASNQNFQFEMRVEDIGKLKDQAENPVSTPTPDAKNQEKPIEFETVGSDFFMSNSMSISNTGILTASIRSNSSDVIGIWSTKTGKLLGKLKPKSQLAAVSQDGKLVALTEKDKKFNQHVKVISIENPPVFTEIIDIPSKEIKIPRNFYFEVSSMSFSADGSLLALGSTGGEIVLIDTKTWKQVHTLEGHSNSVTGLVFPVEGNYLYSTSRDGTIRMWGVSTRSDLIHKNDPIPTSEPEKNNEIFEVKVEASNLLKLDTSSIPQIKELKRWQAGKYDSETTTCTGCIDGIWTFGKEDLEVYLSFYEPGNTFRTLKPYLNDEFSKDILSFEKVADVSAMSNDGKILARGISVKDGIEILDINGNLQQRLTGLTLDMITFVSFSPDNNYLMVATGDIKKHLKSEIVVWDIATKPAKVTSRETINGFVGSLINKPEVVEGYELFASLWKTSYDSPLLFIKVSRDGKIENISTEKVDFSSTIFRMAISPDGSILAFEEENGIKVILFDLISKKSIGEIPVDKIMKKGKLEINSLYYIAFLPDMKGLLVCFQDGSLRLYGVTK